MPWYGGSLQKMSSSGTLSNYFVDSLIGHESEEVYGGGGGGGGGGRFLPGGHHATPRPSSGVVAEGSDFASCSFAPKSAVFSASWSAVHPQPPAPMPAIYHPYMPQPHLGGPGESGGGGGGGRYVRSWIEPFASFPSSPGSSTNNVSAAAAAAAAATVAPNGAGSGSSGVRHYGIVKPESGGAAAAAAAPASVSTAPSSSSAAASCASASPSKRTECSSSREPPGISGPEYTCNSFLAEPREKGVAASNGAHPIPSAAATTTSTTVLPAKPASGCSRNPSPSSDLKEEKPQQLDPSKLKNKTKTKPERERKEIAPL